MQNIRAWIMNFTIIFSASVCCAQPISPYDLCARGLNKDPLKPFLQTLRVKMFLDAPTIDPGLLREVQAQLIRILIWDQKATEVFVEDYDSAECTASAENQTEISAEITQADLTEIKRRIDRGPAVIEQAKKIAKSSSVKLDLASTDVSSQKRWLRVYYVTNRLGTKKVATAEAYGKDRTENLSYGTVDVAVLHDTKMKDLESPAIFKFEKATSLDEFSVAGSYTMLTHDQWLEDVQKRARQFEKPGVLLFIHGYNVNFVDAARRAGQLAYDLAFPGPTVFFSWPSEASVIHYLNDGREAENSWQAAASVLGDMSNMLPNGPLYVVAHSMGNRVMLGGLIQFLEKFPFRRMAIKAVVMAAPDIDQDSFNLNIATKVLNQGIPFTLYASRHDLALGASEFLQGGIRLGMGGKDILIKNGIDSVDASSVTKEFFALNHSYFGDKTGVLSDLFGVIRLGLPPIKRANLKPVGVAPRNSWAILE